MAIRQQTRVHFRLSDGRDCVVKEDGIARIPGIHDIPVLNLEDEFALVDEVRLEVLGDPAKAVLRSVRRAELERLVASGPEAAADEHDE